MIDAIDGVAHVMLKVTGYVMKFAPIAVFAAVAGIIAKSGLGVLQTYGVFMAEFYLGIVLLWGDPDPDRLRAFLGPRVLRLIGLHFARADPAGLLDRLVGSGVPENPGRPGALRRANRIAAFVLPIGYSFNLDGSMMYCTFAAVFIAQAYGIEMSLGPR
jgi:hypothetical protein